MRSNADARELAAQVIELNEGVVDAIAELTGFVPARGRPSLDTYLETVERRAVAIGALFDVLCDEGVAATKVGSLIESGAGLDQIACGPTAALGPRGERSV